MPLYVMLTKMTQQAIDRCNEDETGYHQQIKGPHQYGEVLDFHPVVGRYDYVIMAHAKDIHEAAKLSTEIRQKLRMSVETMPSLGPGSSQTTPTPPMEVTWVREPSAPAAPTMVTGAAREAEPEQAPAEETEQLPQRQAKADQEACGRLRTPN